eukprot:1384310-Alexandrium_andersonii.AAC.1
MAGPHAVPPRRNLSGKPPQMGGELRHRADAQEVPRPRGGSRRVPRPRGGARPGQDAGRQLGACCIAGGAGHGADARGVRSARPEGARVKRPGRAVDSRLERTARAAEVAGQQRVGLA